MFFNGHFFYIADSQFPTLISGRLSTGITVITPDTEYTRSNIFTLRNIALRKSSKFLNLTVANFICCTDANRDFQGPSWGALKYTEIGGCKRWLRTGEE